MTHERIRVVVMSSTRFGFKCIERGVLPVSEIQLCGILTTAREIDISYSVKPVNIRTHCSFSELAERAGCEVGELQSKPQSKDYLKLLRRWQPDLILVLGWYYMVPKQVREFARFGCLGIHASLLPKYRGGAPIPWAIIQGEDRSGVSLFHLSDGVDDGDLVAQNEFSIEPADNCATVYEKATDASVRALLECLPLIANGTAPRVRQNEEDATWFPQRAPEDGLIDWTWDSERIRNFIRAQTRPYPGAFTYIDGKKVTIWDADIAPITYDRDEGRDGP